MHLNQKLCPKECEGAPRAPFGPSVHGPVGQGYQNYASFQYPPQTQG